MRILREGGKVKELNNVPFKPLSEFKKRICEECAKLESIATQRSDFNFASYRTDRFRWDVLSDFDISMEEWEKQKKK